MSYKSILKTDDLLSNWQPVYIIAEAGSNHNQDIKKAKTLIDIAEKAGADAVKFQSFKAENIVSAASPAYEIFKKNELSRDWHKELFNYAEAKGIDFLSTPFDLETATFLKDLGVKAFKIASGDITFKQLLEHIGKLGLPVIISTGKSTLGEIETALEAFSCDQVVLLHCVATYPADHSEVNLSVMSTLKNAFPGVRVGLSDHTLDEICALGAVSLGASVIEKHITYDKSAEGPDHKFAMEEKEFVDMVKKIRNLESAMGDSVKRPSASEAETVERGRRSLHASEDIRADTCISEEQLKIVRPGTGIKPACLNKIIGKKVMQDIKKDTPLQWEHFVS